MSMTEYGLKPVQSARHPLFAEISRADSLSDILNLQIIDIPLVADEDTRLELRQALQARRDVLKAKALADGRFYLPPQTA